MNKFPNVLILDGIGAVKNILNLLWTLLNTMYFY